MNNFYAVKPVRVACDGISVEQLGVSLLGKIYSEVSAYALWNEDGVCEVKLFDTYAPEEVLDRLWLQVGRLILYSNQPQSGAMIPSEDDLHNLARMPERTEFYVICESVCTKV